MAHWPTIRYAKPGPGWLVGASLAVKWLACMGFGYKSEFRQKRGWMRHTTTSIPNRWPDNTCLPKGYLFNGATLVHDKND
jgi:hypothetical protein